MHNETKSAAAGHEKDEKVPMIARRISLLLGALLLGYGCYHLGYVYGYDAAIQWAKGVAFDN